MCRGAGTISIRSPVPSPLHVVHTGAGKAGKSDATIANNMKEHEYPAGMRPSAVPDVNFSDSCGEQLALDRRRFRPEFVFYYMYQKVKRVRELYRGARDGGGSPSGLPLAPPGRHLLTWRMSGCSIICLVCGVWQGGAAWRGSGDRTVRDFRGARFPPVRIGTRRESGLKF